MKFRRKQFTALFILFSLFTLTSGLCYGTFASAHMTETIEVEAHSSCSDQKPVPVQVAKKIPISDTILPCCVDRHNNVSVSLVKKINEKINLSDVSLVSPHEVIAQIAQQKTYISSISPPHRPDILLSVVKKE